MIEKLIGLSVTTLTFCAFATAQGCSSSAGGGSTDGSAGMTASGGSAGTSASAGGAGTSASGGGAGTNASGGSGGAPVVMVGACGKECAASYCTDPNKELYASMNASCSACLFMNLGTACPVPNCEAEPTCGAGSNAAMDNFIKCFDACSGPNMPTKACFDMCGQKFPAGVQAFGDDLLSCAGCSLAM